MKHKYSTYLHIFLLCSWIPSFSQQFSAVHPITSSTGGSAGGSIAADTAGNSFILGRFDKTLSIGDSTFIGDDYYNDIYFAKYNSHRQLLWVKRFGCPTQDFLGNIDTDKEGNCYLVTSFSGKINLGDTALYAGADFSPYNILLAKYNATGKRLWSKQLSPNTHTWLGDMAVDHMGNCYVTGGRTGANFLMKYDKTGNILWQQNIPETGQIAIGPDGGIFMSGILFGRTVFGEKVFDSEYSSFVCKYSANGMLLWATHLKGTNPVQSRGITTDQGGNTYITGNFWGTFTVGKDVVREIGSDSSRLNHDIFVAKFDAAGNGVWGLRAGNNAIASNGNILVDENQSLYVSGWLYGPGTFKSQSIKGGNFVARLDAFGNVIWIKEAEGSYHGGCTIIKASDDLLYVTGSVQGTADFDGVRISSDTMLVNQSVSFLASLRDTIAPIKPNVIRGLAYQDSNNSCRFDQGETSLEHIIIKAEPGNHYSLTDTNGQYTLLLPAGEFTVHEVRPASKAKIITQTCPTPINSHSINFTGTGITVTGFDFGNQVTRLPLLKVDIAADRRRRCFRGSTTVHYNNQGYAAAQNVQIKVYYPQYVIPLNASMAWNRQDSLLTFNLGTLQPGQTGSITITDSVACGNELIRGLTQCVKAIISPANAKTVDSRWDKSDVGLKAVCRNNGLVKLTILNTGSGNMADSSAYRIYLNAVKVFERKYKLDRQDSSVLQVPANGRTVRVEADLPAYHPDGERKPSITLEGCGSNIMAVNVSKGFVNQLPSDDAPEEISVSCLPILDSYDPNDKQASPAGVGPDNIILKNQPIEYLIRFQNTGTDVAYNVVVEDTLDATMDIATLEVGAASHPFTWSVSGVGLPVLTWKFTSINLPDSTTHEADSHGYVRFRIRPKSDTPEGVKINNRAAITFDYNSPVITNPVTHTTGQIPSETQRSLSIDICSGNYPTLADAGKDILVQTSSITLQGNVPGRGHGYWTLIDGKGIIANPTDPVSLVTGLGSGKNVFEWSIALCDTVSRSRIIIERIVIPSQPLVTNPDPYCSGELLLPITATGESLKWYANQDISKLIGKGLTYQPAVSHTDTFYVTQTVDGYESLPAGITVVIKPVVPAPLVDSIASICNGILVKPIVAKGENIRWYSDSSQIKLLYEGATFSSFNERSASTLYVTQTIDGCEGAVSKVHLRVGAGHLMESVFIANVITPNGDGYNDIFQQPSFKEGTCMGQFQSIRVYNRWGKVVFRSEDANFAWRAQGQSTGLYYYEIRYSHFIYRGALSVLH